MDRMKSTALAIQNSPAFMASKGRDHLWVGSDFMAVKNWRMVKFMVPAYKTLLKNCIYAGHGLDYGRLCKTQRSVIVPFTTAPYPEKYVYLPPHKRRILSIQPVTMKLRCSFAEALTAKSLFLPPSPRAQRSQTQKRMKKHNGFTRTKCPLEELCQKLFCFPTKQS